MTSKEEQIMLFENEEAEQTPEARQRNSIRHAARARVTKKFEQYNEGVVTLEELANTLQAIYAETLINLQKIGLPKKSMINKEELEKLAASISNPFVTFGESGGIKDNPPVKLPNVHSIPVHESTPKLGETGESGGTKPAKAPTFPSAEVKPKAENKDLHTYMSSGEAGDIVAKPHEFAVSEHNKPDTSVTSMAVCDGAPTTKKSAYTLDWAVLPADQTKKIVTAAYNDALDCLRIIARRSGQVLNETSVLGQAYLNIVASLNKYAADATELPEEKKDVKNLEEAKSALDAVLKNEKAEVSELAADKKA